MNSEACSGSKSTGHTCGTKRQSEYNWCHFQILSPLCHNDDTMKLGVSVNDIVVVGVSMNHM